MVLWYGSPRKGIYCDIKKLPRISKCPWEWHHAHLRTSAMKDSFPSTCAPGSMDKIAAINVSQFNYMYTTMEKSAKCTGEWRKLSFSSIIYVVLCLVAQLCPTLCNPIDCSLPGFSVHGDSAGKNIGVGCHALPQGIIIYKRFKHEKNTGYVVNWQTAGKSKKIKIDIVLTNFRILASSWEGEQRMREGTRKARKATQTASAKSHDL